jgi:hypothetical protein
MSLPSSSSGLASKRGSRWAVVKSRKRGAAREAGRSGEAPPVLLQVDEEETSAEVGLREVPDLDPDEIRRHTMPPFVSAVD